MTDQSNSAADANAALVALIANTLADHRREVREDIAGIRQDAVLRAEYVATTAENDRRLTAHDRELADVRARLDAERREREAADQRLADAANARSIPWPSIAMVVIGILGLLSWLVPALSKA